MFRYSFDSLHRSRKPFLLNLIFFLARSEVNSCYGEGCLTLSINLLKNLVDRFFKMPLFSFWSKMFQCGLILEVLVAVSIDGLLA